MNKHFLLLLLFLFSCRSTLYVPSVNLAENYGEDFLSPLVNVIHYDAKLSNSEGDSVTAFSFVFRFSSFLSKYENNQCHIQLKVGVKFFHSLNKGSLTDSFSFSQAIPLRTSPMDTFVIIKYRPLLQYPFFALIDVMDINRNKTFQYIWTFEKKLPVHEKNVSLISYNQRRVVSLYDTVKFSLTESFKEVQLRYYTFGDFPEPPFVTSSSLWKVLTEKPVPLRMDSNQYSFVAEQEGLYVLKTASERGFYAWLAVQKNFPLVTTYEGMVKPMRYIMTQKEYEDLIQGANLVEKVEKFWLRLGGNEEMARQLIRRYYHRVVRANELFTNHVEGWRTDRGMMYVVMGAPSSVYRNDQSEVWIYGQENNWMSMQFRFVRKEILSGIYDYVLERNSQYRDMWYNMIEIWRR